MKGVASLLFLILGVFCLIDVAEAMKCTMHKNGCNYGGRGRMLCCGCRYTFDTPLSAKTPPLIAIRNGYCLDEPCLREGPCRKMVPDINDVQDDVNEEDIPVVAPTTIAAPQGEAELGVPQGNSVNNDHMPHHITDEEEEEEEEDNGIAGNNGNNGNTTTEKNGKKPAKTLEEKKANIARKKAERKPPAKTEAEKKANIARKKAERKNQDKATTAATIADEENDNDVELTSPVPTAAPGQDPTSPATTVAPGQKPQGGKNGKTEAERKANIAAKKLARKPTNGRKTDEERKANKASKKAAKKRRSRRLAVE